jgi:ubiquinone/menaquinone biosynthesis C-methylase UbiE
LQDAYASIAEFYDLEHDEFTDDVDFMLQFVESIGDPVLELACGTGRIAVPIAAAGYRVRGSDISSPMLDRARARALNQQVDVQWHLAALEDAHTIPGGPFGVVIMALGALNHLPTQEEQIAALASARRALDPRGALLLDVLHPSPHRLTALDGSNTLDGYWPTDNGGTVQRFSSHTVYPASQTIDTQIWYDETAPSGTLQRHLLRMTQRYCPPGELLLMLREAGFEDAIMYGSYDLEPFSDTSERMLVVAEATKT